MGKLNPLKACKICRSKTHNVFGIDFKAVPVCEDCARTIFIQQAKWFIENTPQLTQK